MKQILFSCFVLLSCLSYTQDSSRVKINGQVIDTNSYRPYYNLMVVNKSTGIGHFGSSTGKFDVTINKSDTLLISTTGYQTIKFSVKDSVYKSKYNIKFYLSQWSIELAEANIKPLKSSDDLQKERKDLEREDVERTKGLEAISSPITALYEFFSQKERSKRLVAKMEYQDKKNKVLKELFRLYVAHDIIDLNSSEFDGFIKFLNIPDSFFRNASEYEMILYIKKRYKLFLRKSDYYVEPPGAEQNE